MSVPRWIAWRHLRRIADEAIACTRRDRDRPWDRHERTLEPRWRYHEQSTAQKNGGILDRRPGRGDEADARAGSRDSRNSAEARRSRADRRATDGATDWLARSGRALPP